VKKINTTECTSDAWIDLVLNTREAHLSLATNVRENIAFPHLNQSQLSVVAVCRVVSKD